jgi:hypothetical protein
MLGIHQPPTSPERSDLISTQCVNYRVCGGNVALLVEYDGMDHGRNLCEHRLRIQVFRQTCPCRYSDDDLSRFRGEIVQGEAHP